MAGSDKKPSGLQRGTPKKSSILKKRQEPRKLSDIKPKKGSSLRAKSPHQSSKKGQQLKILAKGESLQGMRNAYTVEMLLGAGAFGAVYLVRKEAGEELFAIKIERVVDDKEKRGRLKAEFSIFAAIRHVPPEKKKHFVTMIDRGMCRDFKFLVMDLVGPSLEDVRRKILLYNFKKPTALKISMQCLDAIRDIHGLGYLHRDLKPQNFAIGRRDSKSENTIFMLDFGIARRFVDQFGQHKKPRRLVPRLLGSLKFASRASHYRKEQGRKDDLECWIYLTMDLFSVASIPWGFLKDPTRILQQKEAFFAKRDFDTPGAEFASVVRYVDKLAYEDQPNYEFIYKALILLGQHQNLNLDCPFDWAKLVYEQEKLPEKFALQEGDTGEAADDWDDDDEDEEVVGTPNPK